METILIILAIIWVIVPIAAKKKQQDAKAAAERERVARQSAPKATAPQPSQVRTAPLAPTVRPTMQASFEGTASQEGNSSGSMEGTSRERATLKVQEAKSTLTESMNYMTHTVSFSGESGHAHEENSMTGLDDSCPPEKASVHQTAQTAQTASAVSGSAFVWNVNTVRSGLVMAEILGPCLANRDN